MKNIQKILIQTIFITLGLLVLVPVAVAQTSSGTVTGSIDATLTTTSVESDSTTSITKTTEDTTIDALDSDSDADIIQRDKESVQLVEAEVTTMTISNSADDDCDGIDDCIKRTVIEQAEEAVNDADEMRIQQGGTGGTAKSVDMFIKIDDIKGEAEAMRGGNDSTGTDERRLDADDDVENTAKGSKPKEIVVVGSKIREAIAAGVQVRGWDPVTKEVLIRTEDVHTKAMLTDYAGALLASSEEVDSITVGEDDVRVVSTQPVKLFGIFSIGMKQRIEVAQDVNSEARVKVRFPWWSFLAKKSISADEIKIAVESAVNEPIDDAIDMANDAEGISEGQKESRKFQILGGFLKAVHNTTISIIQNIR